MNTTKLQKHPLVEFSEKIEKELCVVIDKNNTLQYIIQFDKTSHDAFNDIIIGLIKKNHSIENIIPHIIKKYTNIEKYFLANGRFFSQRVFEINALHQLPIINQMEAIINNTGTVKFTAVKASFHTKFDTKKPSTTPYIELNNIIIMVGAVNHNNFL